MEQYNWDNIYSLFEKICLEKHISILKNAKVKKVIVPCIKEKHIDIYDFVPNFLYNKNKNIYCLMCLK